MSSATRKGGSHLRQKAKRNGGLSIEDFTEWLNIKSAIKERRRTRHAAKKRYRGRLGGRLVHLERKREREATRRYGKDGPWGWLFH